MVIGGYEPISEETEKKVLHRSVTGVWDSSSWDQLPQERYGHSCCLIQEGQKVLIAGGVVGV